MSVTCSFSTDINKNVFFIPLRIILPPFDVKSIRNVHNNFAFKTLLS